MGFDRRVAVAPGTFLDLARYPDQLVAFDMDPAAHKVSAGMRAATVCTARPHRPPPATGGPFSPIHCFKSTAPQGTIFASRAIILAPGRFRREKGTHERSTKLTIRRAWGRPVGRPYCCAVDGTGIQPTSWSPARDLKRRPVTSEAGHNMND